MPIIMMTSIDTLYEVSAQDTLPINQAGTPHIEAIFNGLTQIALQNPDNIPQNIALAERSFIQQQRYLDDAAHVAVNAFSPVLTTDQRFRATLKLKAIQGELQAFDDESSSSGLAYALALAMTWAAKKCLLTPAPAAIDLSNTLVFATGSVPIDCYVKPVGFVTKKIHHACDHIENQTNNNDRPKDDDSPTSFIILLPKGNLKEVENDNQLTARIKKLHGEIVAVSHFSEALTHLLGNAFDGGIFTQSHHGFAGLHSISYERRRLFMGREELVDELIEKSYTALEQQYTLNVSGVSGSGKSSAVMAGLLPQLLHPKHPISYTIDPHWAYIRPSQCNTINELWYELFEAIHQEAMHEEASNGKNTTKNQTLDIDTLENNLSSIVTITQNIQNLLSKRTNNETHRYIWVIDQYEELFTHNTISLVEAQSVFSLLAHVAEHLPILIITVIRTEYLSTLGGHASIDVQLPRRIQPSEIERIIQLQLSYHRLSTEEKKTESEYPEHQQHLEQRIKNDAIGKPLTTVSYLLEQMHHQMIDEDASAMTLTHQHYDTVGGIEGVMAKQADLAMQLG